MKCIILINVKMATIVDILTFISMLNITSEILKTRKFLFFTIWFLRVVEIAFSVEEHEEVYNLSARA